MRDIAPKPDLFPFLAVLVCTMGALIFLLIAFSVRVAEAKRPVSAAAPAAPVELPLPRGEAIDETRPVRIDPLAGLPRRAAEPASPILPTPQRRIVTPTRTQSEVDAPWQRRLAELEQRRQREAALAAAAAGRKRELEEAIAQREQTLAVAMNAADKQDRFVAAQRVKLAGLDVELEELRRAVATLDEEIDALRSARHSRGKSYRFVTVDHVSGTRRHPIVVVCEPDRWRLPVEGVEIPAQLNGYTTGSNPLLATVAALARHYATDGEPPYVLLVVKPDSLAGFNLASFILRTAGVRYGYELVEADRDLKWPTAGPAATAVAMRALEAVVREPRRAGSPLPRADRDGRFVHQGLQSARRELALASGRSKWDRAAQLRSRQGGFGTREESDRFGGGGRPVEGNRVGETAVAGRGTVEAGRRPTQVASNGVAIEPRSLPSISATGSDEPRTVDQSETASPVGQAGRSIPQVHWRDDRNAASGEAGGPRVGRQAATDRERAAAGGTPSWHRDPLGLQAPPRDDSDTITIDSLAPRSRLWGKTAGRFLGYERQVPVTVEDSRLASGPYELRIVSPSDAELRRLVVELLDRWATEWGPPPDSVFWRPTIVLTADPGSATARRIELLSDGLSIGVIRTSPLARPRQSVQPGRRSMR